MRDQSSHVTMTHEQAVKTLLEHCDFDQQTETIPLIEAYHRVLAEDIVAKQDKPNCLTCLMDSVAVHWDDFENGMPDTSGWERGKQWEFANTGIGMPEGFDSAIVVENVTFSDDDTHVSFAAAPSARFAGTKPAGSTFKEGELLIWSGTVITPGIAAVIAEAGYTQVSVIRKPRVAFIPTGNELVPPQGAPARAKVVDSNSIMLRGKVREWGGEPITYDIVPDDPELIEQALRRACEEADIVVINAGSSKGSADFNIEVLEKIGTVFYHETNHGPGHHSSGAVVDGTPVVNSAGDPFDSVPEVEAPAPTFTKVIKFAGRHRYADFLCTVNANEVTIGGMTCAPYTLLCSVSEKLNIGDNQWPYTYTVRLKYRTNIITKGGDTQAGEIGWQVAVVDAGMREKDDTTGELKLIQILSKETGQAANVTAPELLDGHGKAVARSASGAPATPYNLTFMAYKAVTWPSWFYSEPGNNIPNE